MTSQALTICSHDWVEDYYGTKCQRCGTFYPFSCAPWDGSEWEEGSGACEHGVGFYDYCEWCEDEEDGVLDLEDRFDRTIERAFARFKS